jgi:formate dehydrogenase (NADP+) beta subunit
MVRNKATHTFYRAGGFRDYAVQLVRPLLGVTFVGGKRIDSMKALLAEDFDAIFVGCGAPRGRDLDIPGRKEAARNIHIGIDWLSSVSFGHIDRIGKRVIVLGGGNTAMDCCRSSRRLGGKDVKVVVPPTSRR